MALHPWITINQSSLEFRCQRCGAVHSPKLPAEAMAYLAAIGEFIRDHSTCKEVG